MNRKFILSSCIALLVLFGSTLGIGFAIGAANKSDDDLIRYYIGGKEYTPTSTTDNSNEIGANEILKKYYSAALFGNSDFSLEGNKEVGTTHDYIFKLKNKGNWNVAPIVSKGTKDDEIKAVDLAKLKENFIKMKFFNDTISTSVFEFLMTTSEENENNTNLFNLALTLEKNQMTNLRYLPLYSATNIDIGTSAIPELIDGPEFINDKVIPELEKDADYNNSVLKEMYIYSYLWQNSSSKSYDYNLTKELVRSKPSIVSSMEIDTEKAKGNLAFESLKNHSSPTYKKVDWNKNFDDLETSLIDVSIKDEQIKVGAVEGLKGFGGIKMGSSVSDVGADWTNISNTWDTKEANSEGKSITKNALYNNKNILFGTDQNIYLADPNNKSGANGRGALIVDVSSDVGDNTGWDKLTGNANIYSYSQLWPYAFAEQIDKSGSMSYTTYSLFANIDSTNDTLTKGKLDDTTSEYIFDRWFDNTNSTNKEQAALGEIAITQAIISNNSSIEAKALTFWKDKGFYIELSGKFATNYASLIPDAILKED